MPVANDLQTVSNRLSAAIAGGDSYTRVELTRLRDELGHIREEAAREEREGKVARMALDELADGVEAKVLDLRGLARHARGRVAQTGTAGS